GGAPAALGDELLEQRLAPRDADDHGAALGEGAGGDVADAGGRAGHDDDLAAIVGGHRGLQQAPRGCAVKRRAPPATLTRAREEPRRATARAACRSSSSRALMFSPLRMMTSFRRPVMRR